MNRLWSVVLFVAGVAPATVFSDESVYTFDSPLHIASWSYQVVEVSFERDVAARNFLVAARIGNKLSQVPAPGACMSFGQGNGVHCTLFTDVAIIKCFLDPGEIGDQVGSCGVMGGDGAFQPGSRRVVTLTAQRELR